MITPLFSIIIPVRQENDYLRQTLEHLNRLKTVPFEILVVTDAISQTPNPAIKRNIGAHMARGKFLAFLDDDSYPHPDWLVNAYRLLCRQPQTVAVCGPCLTPPDDNLYQQASGLVWSHWFGSGGAGTYRNHPSPPRFVDDYPSVNLLVRRSAFLKVGGYPTQHWPGEDTLLCLKLIQELKRQILYHPSIVVYHHRRPVFKAHLQQLQRYAQHRGLFARLYPTTSRRFGYFLPSLFLIYLLSLPFVYLSFFWLLSPGHLLQLPLLPIYLYLSILLISLVTLLFQTRNLHLSLLSLISIPLTHLTYGWHFIIGFSRPRLHFLPHNINPQTGNYLGG
jgi:cellulose synthase/poly-beta-1,6-N-acetylglucosamine synthase-like glycosyltransferase